MKVDCINRNIIKVINTNLVFEVKFFLEWAGEALEMADDAQSIHFQDDVGHIRVKRKKNTREELAREQ